MSYLKIDKAYKICKNYVNLRKYISLLVGVARRVIWLIPMISNQNPFNKFLSQMTNQIIVKAIIVVPNFLCLGASV